MEDSITSKSDYSYHYSKFFDGSDKEFDSMSHYYEKKLRRFEAIDPTSKVLEIGSGWGFCLGGLRRIGVADALGFDINRTACDIAAKRGLNVKLVDVSDISAFMRTQQAQYDVVLAFDVLEHVPLAQRDEMLKEVVAVLKPGGSFICQVPNANSIIAPYMRHVDYTHTDTFTHISLDAVLHNAGFESIIVEDADPMPARPPFLPLSTFKAWAMKRILRKILRSIYVAELGSSKQVWSFPLDKNIIATARRRCD